MVHSMRKMLNVVKRICETNRLYSTKTKFENHPYNNIHPWKSQTELSKFLLNNVVYEHEGLVVLNKPYGIPVNPADQNHTYTTKNKIVDAVPYSIFESLSYLAEKLKYSNLRVVKSPEKYMSGLTLLCDSDKMERKVTKSIRRESHLKSLPISYWIVTTKLPKEIKGNLKLALGLKKSIYDPKSEPSPTIYKNWSKNELKRREKIPFDVNFKLLSNSQNNLASLIEVKISKRNWHAIRLFAAHILHSPVLGDNIYGYLIQKTFDSYVNVGPFSELRGQLPVLNKELLKVLSVPKFNQEIIPVHIHLRKITLSKYLGTHDLTFEAPLMPEFQYTCDRLKFKYLMPEKEPENSKDEEVLQDCIEKMEQKV